MYVIFYNVIIIDVRTNEYMLYYLLVYFMINISKVIYILSAYLNISLTERKQLCLYMTMRSIVNTIIFICIND